MTYTLQNNKHLNIISIHMHHTIDEIFHPKKQEIQHSDGGLLTL